MTPDKEERLFGELGGILREVQGVRKDLQAHEELDRVRFGHLEKSVEDLEGAANRTDQHQLTATEKELERMRLAETRLTESRWGKVLHVALLVFGAAISFIATRLAH